MDMSYVHAHVRGGGGDGASCTLCLSRTTNEQTFCLSKYLHALHETAPKLSLSLVAKQGMLSEGICRFAFDHHITKQHPVKPYFIIIRRFQKHALFV